MDPGSVLAKVGSHLPGTTCVKALYNPQVSLEIVGILILLFWVRG